MDDRIALVTGGSRGIGRAIACALRRDGMRVVINYRDSRDKAEQLSEELGGSRHAVAVQGDISDPNDVQRLKVAALNAFGRVDILVNNAGAIVQAGDWNNADVVGWRRTVDVNLVGAFNCIQAFAQDMVNRRWGRIISIGSTYGQLGAAAVVAYSAAKAGLVALTRSMAKELAPWVTVNLVSPGNIDTDMTRGAGESLIEKIVSETPLGRLGSPEDVAGAVSYLGSERAGFITGIVLVVDGGHMLK